ncbi:MAG: glutathione S-transferase family protein [Pseudomonadales bacterium]|nr:glutathione S-transferase family protein [Pseudomonadales bacterium]MCP5185546.1 glutathione S-transferase family protein [Pseudomonadales bacterium]
MSLTVYEHPLSPYAQKVKIALTEKGVAFTATTPQAIGSGASAGAFAAASPRGEVPVLVLESGEALFDSTVILEYIEDRWPEPPLLPAEPLARARLRELEDVMDTHFEAITWGLGEIRHFGRGGQQQGEALFARGLEQLHGWYAWLARRLGAAPWFTGEHFGWGDICVAPFVNGAVSFGAQPSGALAAWLARVNDRPSVAAAKTAAEAVALGGDAPSLEMVRQALEQGLFKREYRDHRLEWMIRTGGIEVVADGLAKGNIRFTEVFG